MASFHRRLASIESIERTAVPRYTYAGGMDVDAPELRDLRDPRDLRLAATVGHDDDDDPAGPAGAGVPRVSRRALRRRRQIFFSLMVTVVSSLGAAVVTGDVTAWIAHSASVLMFVSYIGLLVRHHQRVAEQVAKVRYLSPIRTARPAVVVLRSGTAR
jgi:hypothetical protein